tara:strand:- start:347 stop:601 length:255 start_codon:yes stop_codon:yes gene_type:complete
MLEKNHVLEVLNRIFKEKLCDQTVEINLDTTADDILEWNSLKHLVIILAIENHFQIKFNPIQLSNMQNIEEMINTIIGLVKSKN